LWDPVVLTSSLHPKPHRLGALCPDQGPLFFREPPRLPEQIRARSGIGVSDMSEAMRLVFTDFFAPASMH
jgi:hypothetical protein